MSDASAHGLAQVRDAGAEPLRHGAWDDLFAGITGTALVALGFHFLQRGGLATGGTAGLSLLIHYATGQPLGIVFFLVNVPFYVFAYLAVGPAFAVRTFVAVVALASEAMLLPKLMALGMLDPVFAAGMGGLLVGVGLLVLVRHRSSLGGFGILAIYLQASRGWSAGKVQMALDCAVVALAFAVLDPRIVALSVFGAVVLNLVLALNHRPGRYAGF
ncbi:YitT family protein [Methylobacterium sp. JK268]